MMGKIDTYDKAIRFLYDQLPMFQRVGQSAYKANLDNTHTLDKYFGFPHRRFASIHVAGTNGKGSVSHLLASILAEAGYKTGLYTSPHLKDFRERIKINGQSIPQTEVVGFVNQHRPIVEDVKPSFFEMTVAMAFDYFARQQVAVAVIEVGLGGRLDSTNIIMPRLSVITNIGFDHVAILGDTLSKIAFEKAGVIKPNVPVVVGEVHAETLPIFLAMANERNSDLYKAEELFQVPFSTQSVDQNQLLQVYRGNVLLFRDLKTPLLGFYQRKNTQTVLGALEILKMDGWGVTSEHIYRGFANVIANTGLMGRWQVLEHNPLVVCDTGHNEDGIKEVVNQINQTPHEHLHVVLGMVSDKDIDHVLRLLPREADYYFTQAQLPRALDAEILCRKAQKQGLRGVVVRSVVEAKETAKKNAGINDLIFIGGSTFVVAEAL
ncbi:MAG: folylpolyglutamate synthase/dihydrofolate synthase family protein [Breznakibacter sp.]